MKLYKIQNRSQFSFLCTFKVSPQKELSVAHSSTYSTRGREGPPSVFSAYLPSLLNPLHAPSLPPSLPHPASADHQRWV